MPFDASASRPGHGRHCCIETRPNVRETNPPKRSGLTVNELYEQLKEMAVLYTIRPGERVNELELAQRYEVSRTPLREALNRLVAENLFQFVPNRGFFARELHRQDIFDLFELRRSIESTATLLAVDRADVKDVRALRTAITERRRTSPQSMNIISWRSRVSAIAFA